MQLREARAGSKFNLKMKRKSSLRVLSGESGILCSHSVAAAAFHPRAPHTYSERARVLTPSIMEGRSLRWLIAVLTFLTARLSADSTSHAYCRVTCEAPVRQAITALITRQPHRRLANQLLGPSVTLSPGANPNAARPVTRQTQAPALARTPQSRFRSRRANNKLARAPSVIYLRIRLSLFHFTPTCIYQSKITTTTDCEFCVFLV